MKIFWWVFLCRLLRNTNCHLIHTPWNIDPPIKKEYYFKSFVVITLKFLTVIKNYASYYLKKNLALDTQFV